MMDNIRKEIKREIKTENFCKVIWNMIRYYILFGWFFGGAEVELTDSKFLETLRKSLKEESEHARMKK